VKPRALRTLSFAAFALAIPAAVAVYWLGGLLAAPRLQPVGAPPAELGLADSSTGRPDRSTRLVARLTQGSDGSTGRSDGST
jgi:hypothetical protein